MRDTSSQRLPQTVVFLGWVSLFTDVASEAVFPLLPAFLAAMGASATFLGLMEGAAEAVSNTLKYVVGARIDRQGKLKRWVLFGYGLSTLMRPLWSVALFPWHVLAVRLGDRVGKGIRTSPRDALIAWSVEPAIQGRAFGFHRAMDHAGAALGTVLCLGLLWALGATDARALPLETLRTIFLCAAVPGLLAMGCLLFIREPSRQRPLESLSPPSPPMPQALRRVLGPMSLFAFANATDAFILLKAIELGASYLLAPLLWFFLHVLKAGTATWGGRLADLHGRRQALVWGWSVYAVTWTSVGFAQSLVSLCLLTTLYGTAHGLTEGAERALVSELSDGRGKGRAFGAYHLLMGFSAMAASLAFGLVWDSFGSTTAFVVSGSCALVSALWLHGLRSS